MSKIFLVAGPTASGKSKIACSIAKKINGEIINADSMQIYKELKILTARPLKKEQQGIKHHLYGFVSVNKNFSTGEWIKHCLKKINEIKKRKKIPIIVGGTGLYFKSLENGLVQIPKILKHTRHNSIKLQKKLGQKLFYKNLIEIDPCSKIKIEPNDVQRSIRAYEVIKQTKLSLFEWFKKTNKYFDQKEFVKILIDIPREELLTKINKRIDKMIKLGAINEAKKFDKMNIKKSNTSTHIIGLKDLSRLNSNQSNIEDIKEKIAIKTRQYAKRQLTWSRGQMKDWVKVNPKRLNDILKSISKT